MGQARAAEPRDASDKGGAMRFTITGRDVVAAVLLVGAFTLRFMGLDGLVETLILGVALAYGALVIPRPGGN